MVSFPKRYQYHQIGTPLPSGQSRHHRLPLVVPIPLLLTEAFLPPLRVTLTHFTLFSYERALRLPTSFPISGLARLGVKPRLCISSLRAFASTHPLMLPSTCFREALVACPPCPPWNLPSFTMESTLSTPCSRSDPPHACQGAALAHLDSLPPHDLILWTDGFVPFPFGKGGSGVLANCSLCGTEATLSFSAGPVCSSFSAEAFAILHALCWSRQHQQVCHFSSLLLLSDSRSVLATLSSPPSFLLSQTLWQIWQELSSFSFCSIRLQCPLFLNVYAPCIRSSPTDGRTDSFSPSILPSSRNLFILGDFNCHHPLWDSRGTSDPRGEEVFDWVISSDLLPLNDPDTPTLLHRSSGSRFSPDISFAPSTLAFSCSWEVLQDLGSDHLPILLSVPHSPVFHPNERPPSFNFQKARWDDFASYFDSHCRTAEEYSSLPLSSAVALFTSLAMNAAKSSIPFGRIKRHPKAWWSAEVEEAVGERRKAFATAHRSDEDRQAYISASRRASSVIAKAKTEAWQTTCTSLSPKSNPKSVHSLLCSIAGSPSSSSSSPNFPNCSSPRESASVYAAYLRSHFSVSQPKALRSRARGYLTELRRAT